MTARGDAYRSVLQLAADEALRWLDDLPERPVGPRVSPDQMLEAVGGPLPEHGTDAGTVVAELAAQAEPGLIASQSGRFFGWVMGGTYPAALGADWLVSAWDQNAVMRQAMPAVTALEETAAGWLLDLLGLPGTAGVGFVTGATMANFTCLAAARVAVLERVGWDVNADGLSGAPRVHVLVGEERHGTIDLALRYLGLGRPTLVAADGQGRILPEALEAAFEAVPDGAPVIVCLQAGNLHSGAFDPFEPAIAAAHARGAWVHVDGAFGLWAAASSRPELTTGVAAADSWTTDAHKTLNVPYDSGVAVVRDAVAMRTAFALAASYLVTDGKGPGDPIERTPEFSRRARGVPVYAVLRALGRDGVRDLLDRLMRHAGTITEGVAAIPGAQVLNEVGYTQICVAFDDDDTTRAITEELIAGGEVWMSGSQWRGRAVVRISVSNWSTDDEDVRRAVAAVRTAAGKVRNATTSPV